MARGSFFLDLLLEIFLYAIKGEGEEEEEGNCAVEVKSDLKKKNGCIKSFSYVQFGFSYQNAVECSTLNGQKMLIN